MTGAGDRTEVLFQLQEAIARRRAAGAPLLAADLAREFGLPQDEVERSLAGVAALAALAPAATAGASDLPPLPPPALPADYDLLGEVGRGGMGVVYKARQKSLDRVVAVKVLRPGDLRPGDVVQRFRSEARSLARLRHPHIVPIHEVGEAGGLLYFTMDFIDGASLAELIRRGDVTPTRTVHVLRQVASAVAYSHAQGVVHRDLKPANVLVDAQGQAFVADFGLARDVAASDRTASGQILGTPAYMSPEQARGDAARIGERSDVYALGAILYECLTGRPPFAGLGLAELVHAVLHDEPRAPRRIRPDVPRDLELICRKAMAKEPEQRYATAHALLEDLERFHDGRPLHARPPSLAYRGSRLLRRHWRALLSGSVVAAALMLAFLAVVLPLVRPPAAATLAAATALSERGEHRAALVLLDRARGEAGAADLFDPLHRARAAARLGLMHAALAGGDAGLAAASGELKQAADHAGAMVADDARALVVDAAWALAARAAAADQDELVDQATAAVDRVLAARRLAAPGGLPDLMQLLALGLGHGSGKPLDLLQRLQPALVDGKDGLHAVALRFLTRNLVAGEPRPEILAWLRTQATQDPRVLLPLLTRLDELTASRREALVRQLTVRERDGALAEVVRSRAGQDVLAGLAGDAQAGGVARAVAADLLAAALDLPPLLPRASEHALLPRADNAAVAAVVALWREVRDLDRDASFARRLAAALATPPQSRALRAWLDQHTLAAPGAQPDHGTATAWQEWWVGERAREPRARLAQALGLAGIPGPSDLPALLDRFLLAADRERAALHHLLALTVPERPGQLLPLRPWPEHESVALPMQWWRAVHGDGPGPSFHLRAVALAWRDGAGTPEVVWEDARLVRLDEVVQLRRTGPVPALPVAYGTPRVPGFDIPAPGSEGSLVESLPTVAVRWTPRRRIELCPVDGDAEFTARHVHVGSHSVSRGFYGVREGDVAVALATVLPAWTDGGQNGERVVCVTFTRSEGAPAPWGLAGWQQALTTRLRQLPTEFWRAAPPATGCDFGRLDATARAIELAAYVPVPQARGDLERLTLVIPQHQPPGSDEFSRTVTRARLLLGDAAPMRSPHFAVQAPVVDGDGSDRQRDLRFWHHVLLATPDPELRAAAVQRLDAALLTPGLCDQLAARADLLPTLPGPLAQRLAPGRRWQDRVPDHLDVALPSLLGLTMALLLGLRLLLRAARGVRAAPGDGLLAVVAGQLTILFDVQVRGVALLPDWLGAALTALGIWWLLRDTQRALGAVLAAGLALAAGVDLAGALGAQPVFTRLAAVTLTTGVLALLPLAVRRERRVWQLLALLATAVFLYGVAPALHAEWRTRLAAGFPAWSFWGGPAWNWGRQGVPLGALAGLLLALALSLWPRRAPAPVVAPLPAAA